MNAVQSFVAAAVSVLLFFSVQVASASSYCSETSFPSTADLYELTSHVGNLGLRSPTSNRQKQLLGYIGEQMRELSLNISYNNFSLPIWKTTEDQTLSQAGALSLSFGNGTSYTVDIGGAMPYSLPTNGTKVSAPIVYVPSNTTINSTDVRGKIVLRDFGPTTSPSYSTLFGPAYYRTPDTDVMLNESYNRPYTYTPNQDLADAGLGGAVGMISMFDIPTKYIKDYYDPHAGIQRSIPGLYIGKEAADCLKRAESSKTGVSTASMSVTADIGPGETEEITATLPGRTEDAVYVICHTDGNTWVQDNGVAATIALARYFAKQPLSTRNKTLKFVFTSGHLAASHDGNKFLAARLDEQYDEGDIALVIPLEHMGVREILPKGSASGAANGNDLEFTGKGELIMWSVGPMDPVVAAVNSATKHRNLDHMLVTRGTGLPDVNKVPNYLFGGIGSYYNQFLVPTTSIVSGPWSLWAPYFGQSAIDFGRFRSQILAVSDVIIGVDGLSKKDIAGDYIRFRQERAAGVPVNTGS